MSTNLTIALSQQLQSTLSSTTNGQVGIWAVYFTDTGAPVATALQVGSTPTPTTQITLPNPYDGGKVYLIIQSIDPTNPNSPPALTFGTGNVIAQESDINWTSADTNQFRYDSFELSLLGAAADAGNLTDVNVFGIPMSVEIAYPNGAVTQTRGYQINGSSVFGDINDAFTTDGGLVHNFEYGPLAGLPRLAAAPTTALAPGGPGGASASDWNAYVESIGNEMAASVRIAGQYNGAGTVDYVIGQTNVTYSEWHNAGFYSYTLTYEKEPATVYSASSTLGANPFSAQVGSSAITVTDPNAGQYVANQTYVTFQNATAFAGFSAAELNSTYLVTNVIDANTYQFVIQSTQASETATGGGSGIVTSVPLGENPFSANAGDMFFTVTDPTASKYAAEGVEVTFGGAEAFAGFTADYLNGTTFTITNVISATQYQVATSTAAQAGTGGGDTVAPTYVRPNAGTYVFTPDDNSQIQGTIKIDTQDLANSIYSTLGVAQIYSPDGTPYEFTTLVDNVGTATTDLNTGFNTQWGAFFVKLLTGYIGGYLGGTGDLGNLWTGGATTVDLSQNWNFDPSYAFGSSTMTPWTWDATQYGSGVPYDKYAQIFFAQTNSYGNGYSDALMSLFQQGGPLIPTGYAVTLGANPFATTAGSNIVTVSDPNAGTYGYQAGDLVTFAGAGTVGGINMATPPSLNIPGDPGKAAFVIHSVANDGLSYTVLAATNATASATGGGPGVVAGLDVSSITLTLYDDNETPPSGTTLADHQLYTPTEIYNTSAGPFVSASGTTDTFDIQFALGLGQMRPASDLLVSLGFFDGIGNPGEWQFQYVTFDTSTETLYQSWNYDGDANTLTAAGQAAPTGTNLTINDVPYATGVNWYQLVFADKSNPGISRTYNIYMNGLAGSGILNPNYVAPGINQAGSIAIDGLASYTGMDTSDQYLTDTNLTFNMFNGGTLSMDPRLLELITDTTIIQANPGVWQAPMAPVLGTLSGSTFSNWGGSTTLGTPNANLTNVTDGSLAFGWFASDQSWLDHNAENGQGGVIGGYTNKIGGLNTAQISFLSGAGLTAHAPISAVADIDGKWTTAEAAFSNGTYSAVLTEFLGNGTAVQVGNQGAALTFTVDLPTLDFLSTDSYIALDGTGGGAAGNWITLQTANSSLRNGTLLVYATDANGDLIGRDGQVGASLEESVLARIGAVAFDNGTVMGLGTQSVYLPVGLQLHFAIQTADNVIEPLPGIVVTGSGSLAVNVSGAFGTLNLSATVDNTLSAAAQLAQSQQQYDEAWVYLTQGSTVEVDVAGSAWNLNTIHFVKIDVDATTGAWSVDGVAYGNTDAFRTAVQENWDPNFAVSGGRGNFTASTDWVVSQGTGYYAPVLYTESGNTLVIGTANADGQDHIRTYGQNMFGFEDLLASQGSDFDYNDLVMKIAIA